LRYLPILFDFDIKALKLFDMAIAEAEKQGILDCAAFINER
jgi:hypothetical protein